MALRLALWFSSTTIPYYHDTKSMQDRSAACQIWLIGISLFITEQEDPYKKQPLPLWNQCDSCLGESISTPPECFEICLDREKLGLVRLRHVF